ncbi:hypothetical protein ACHAXT_012194 [Thalassiosira profunda]
MASNEFAVPPPPPPITPTSRPPAGIVARMKLAREGREPKTAVARMVRARESGEFNHSGGGPSPSKSPQKGGGSVSPHKGIATSPSKGSLSAASAGKDAATITRIKLAKEKKRRERSMKIGASADSSVGGSKDKYAEDRSQTSGKSEQSFLLRAAHGRISHSPRNGPGTPRRGNTAAGIENTWLDASSVHPESVQSHHIGLQSLLSVDTLPTIDSMDQEIMDTELCQKFQEAFALTLRNNPGMLPGAPGVVDSIKQSLMKVQRSQARQEKEMRARLAKAKAEKDAVEQELRKEMGTTALGKSELQKELDRARQGKFAQQDSLTKQLEAVRAIKHEFKMKEDGVTKEKEELARHLTLLAKSRRELETALEKEMRQVEKDRNSLQGLVAERKRLQRQKEENKEMERKIERLTEEAGKEKQVLQAEAADLQKFEDHVAQIRRENDAAKQALEQAQRELKETTAEMQTKKCTLEQTKREMEVLFQQEIEELEGQIGDVRLMHDNEMERVVRNRVWSYLGRPERRIEGAKKEMDVEALVQSRVEAEMRSRKYGTGDKYSTKYSASGEELEDARGAKREIEKLKEELELVQARNPRHSTGGLERGLREEMRQEIDTLRDEVRLGSVPPSPAYRSEGRTWERGAPSAPFSPRSYVTPRSQGRWGYADEEPFGSPPLSRRSPRARMSLDSRYYL